MKKTIATAILIMIAFVATAQPFTTSRYSTTANIGGSTTRNNVPGWLSANSMFSVPRIEPSTFVASSFPGSILFRTTDNKLYTSNGTSWDQLNPDLNINAPLNYDSSTKRLGLDTTAVILARYTRAQRDQVDNTLLPGVIIYQTDNTPGLRLKTATGWVRFTTVND